MTFVITKDFHFSAAHRLEGLPADHQCARLHGHNYVARVEISGARDPVGFVLDYGDLSFVGRYVDQVLDHRNLNDVLDSNPTAENLAHHLWELVTDTIPDAVMCTGVGVSETPKTWAWCRP